MKKNGFRIISGSIFLFLILIFSTSAAFAAPVVLYTDITSGPNTGGENNRGIYVSIFGKNFGSDISKVKVYVGGGEVARYMYLGNSYGRPDVQQISVQLGPATATGAIRVNVNGVDSNTDQTFTVRSGNIYFVSATGNDSTGVVNDITHPYRTPNHVVRDLSAFTAGDFVVVRGGTFSLQDGTNNLVSNTFLRPTKSGTSSKPLGFMGYPGETVTIQLNSQAFLFAHYETIAYWTVSNFYVVINHCQTYGDVIDVGNTAPTSAICSSAPGSVLGYASYVRVVNIEMNGRDTGGLCSGHDATLMVGNSDNVKVLGVSIHNTSPALAGTESAHLIYLNVRQTNTEVGWNSVYNVPASRAIVQVHQDNYGCFGTKAITGIKIHDNTIHDVAGQAILLDGGTGDIDIWNNLIYNSGLLNDHRYEDTIALRGSGNQLNARLFNNTVYNNAWYTNAGWLLGMGAIASSDCPQSITLYNNVFMVTEAQDKYYRQETPCSTNAYITSNNNLWFGSSSGIPSFGGSNELNVNPLFTNTSINNFHLQTGSPATRVGSSTVSGVVQKDYDGNLWLGGVYDLGAFKYFSTSRPNPPRNLIVN